MASSLPTPSSSQVYDPLLLADTPPAPTGAAEQSSIANATPPGGLSQEEFIDNDWIDAMLVAVEGFRHNFERDDGGGDDNEAPPQPFNSAEFDEGNAEKWAAASRARAQVESTDDDVPPPATSAGITVPPRCEIQNESIQVPSSHISNRVPLFLADGGGGCHDINTYSRPRQTVETRTHPTGGDVHASGQENEDVPDDSLQSDTNRVRSDFERDSTIVVPEATLVRDSEVYIATQIEPIEPAIPWWKQRRTRFLLGALVVIVITFSIALALSLREDGNTEAPEAQVIVVVNSPVPSFSMAPSTTKLLATMAPALPWVTCPMDPNCGATLETWTGIDGDTIVDLMGGTNNLENTPSRTEHLGQFLKAPSNTDDYYGSQMKGWLIPPVTGEYLFWVASDDQGELFLSSDDHPENKVRVCFAPWYTGVMEWTWYSYQQSTLIPLVAGDAYYFEVSPAIFLAVLHLHVLILYRSYNPLFVHEV